MIEETMIECLLMTRNFDMSPTWAHGLKLSEECGEVNEAILKDYGFLEHKELKEGIVDEVADVINVCMALLTSAYPDASIEDIAARLDNAMQAKNKKYYDILTKGKNDD